MCLQSFSIARRQIHDKSIDDFAHFLTFSGLADRIVVDKTGLTGNCEFHLKWTPDAQQGTPDAGPTLFTALEEQIGLKLVSTKSPVDVLVVDHIERPSANYRDAQHSHADKSGEGLVA